MNMSETANFIEILQKLGWSGDQINNFLLGIEGRISLDETAKRIEEENKNK